MNGGNIDARKGSESADDLVALFLHAVKTNSLCTPLLVLALFIAGCSGSSSPKLHSDAGEGGIVLLISLDGFLPDYLERFDTPNLDRLAAEGTRAESLIPAFPPKTFPNHYSIVTGLHPSNHGVVSNTMYDPEMDATFRISDNDAVSDGRWWGGEPLWVTVQRQGGVAATFFWPGSEAEIGGVRPRYWKRYEHNFPNHQRIDTVLAWIDLPEEERPSFITLYFSDVDSQGHAHGPFAEETERAVAHVDSLIGLMLDGLEARDILDEIDLIVVSDHGMSEVSSDRVVILDDYVDIDDLHIVDRSPVLMARPTGVDARAIVEALNESPQLDAYHRDDVPEHWHFKDHVRIPEVIAAAADGWTIMTRSQYERFGQELKGGAHGYDNLLPSMRGIFIARGPSFEAGQVVGPFGNVHLYNMMAAILGVDAAPNDGSIDSVSHVFDLTQLQP